MKTLTVRPSAAGALKREDELAWRLAELAVADWPVSEAAAEECANRLIDIMGVALAGHSRSPVAAARAQAFAHPRSRGALLIGCPNNMRFDCEWAAWANCAAVRELDFHDNFFGLEACHPGDAIPALLAVAQQMECTGGDLIRGIVTAYEVQIALAKAIPLARSGIDHVGHLGPAIAAGVSSMLRMSVEHAYQAIQSAAHLSISTRQTRRGLISSWKAQAPGHVAMVAIIACDRALRGETSPTPIYEGGFGLITTLLGGPDASYDVEIPDAADGKNAILETYTKEYSAAYHGQAAIDLAARLRARLGSLEEIKRIVIHTHRAAHIGMGSGSGDPEKWDPAASRETLDHSLMYVFSIALEDGEWHHEHSYAPERARRLETVRLWQNISTSEDPELTRRYLEPRSLDKFQGMRAEIEMRDGSVLVDEIDVSDAHPRGSRPFGRDRYREKFAKLSGMADEAAAARFLSLCDSLSTLEAPELAQLNVVTRSAPDDSSHPRAIF